MMGFPGHAPQSAHGRLVSFFSTNGMASHGTDTALVGLGNLSGAEQT